MSVAKETTAKIKGLLRLRHTLPEWCYFDELRNMTGYEGQARYIDGFAVNMYTSRKFWRVAYEIKVSRSDFAHELAQPEKREFAERYANECYFVMPTGMVKVDEIPEGWGLILLNKKQTGIRIKKRARQRNSGESLPMPFMASLMRSVIGAADSVPSMLWKYAGEEVPYDKLKKLADYHVRRENENLRAAGEQAEARYKKSRHLLGLESVLLDHFSGQDIKTVDGFRDALDQMRWGRQGWQATRLRHAAQYMNRVADSIDPIEQTRKRSIGDALVAYRHANRMSQAQLAKELDISRNYLSQIERGQSNNISLSISNRIKQVIGGDVL